MRIVIGVHRMILLTEKDADFIANVARRELENVEENFKALQKDIEEKKEFLEKMIPMLHSETSREEYNKKLDILYESSKELCKKQLLMTTLNFTRIIELMTVGSRTLEDNND